MPPETSNQLRMLVEEGTLVLHTGRLISVDSNDSGLSVYWQDVETGKSTISVDRIINCTGPSRDITHVQSSLVVGLLTDGWITPDPLGLGPQTDLQGRLTQTNGQASPNLYAIGPLRIASLWESIAIPEIRNQALELARLLISDSLL